MPREKQKCHSSKANEITTKIEHLFLPVENYQTAGKNHYVLFLERVRPSIANYHADENNLSFLAHLAMPKMSLYNPNLSVLLVLSSVSASASASVDSCFLKILLFEKINKIL